MIATKLPPASTTAFDSCGTKLGLFFLNNKNLYTKYPITIEYIIPLTNESIKSLSSNNWGIMKMNKNKEKPAETSI